MTTKPTDPRRFTLSELAKCPRTGRDLSLSARQAGINRRCDGLDSWADLPLRQLSDLGYVEATSDTDLASRVYRITSAGRKAAN